MLNQIVAERRRQVATEKAANPLSTMEKTLRRGEFATVPLAVMTYVNTILSYGPKVFIRTLGAAGISSIIVPGLPLEEAGGYLPEPGH